MPGTASRIISIVFFGVLLFDFLAQYIQIRIMQRVGQQTMYDMRTAIFRHIQRLPMVYFDRNPVGRLITRVTTDVDALNDLFAAGVVTMINDFFSSPSWPGWLFSIDHKLAFDALAVLPFILVVTYFFRKYVRDANRRIRTAVASINAYLQEYISGMSVVQLFNREQKARAEFNRRNRENMVAWRDAILAFALFYPAVEILSIFATALIYWSGGNRVLNGTLSLGVLTAFTMYATRFFRPIQDLSEKFNILQSAMAASERIFKLLDEPAPSPLLPMPSASTRRAAKSNSATSGSATPTKPNPPTTTGFSATSLSASLPAKPSPSSATPAPAKPRSSRCSSASTTSSAAKSFSTASTFAKSTFRTCAACSASSSRIRSSSAARSSPTFASARPESIANPSFAPAKKSASPTSSARSPKASPPPSTNAAQRSASASANSSISPAPSPTIRASSSSTKPRPAWTPKPNS